MDFINYKKKKNKNGMYYYYKVDKNNKKIIISKNEYVHNKNNINKNNKNNINKNNINKNNKNNINKNNITQGGFLINKEKQQLEQRIKLQDILYYWNFKGYSTYISNIFFNSNYSIIKEKIIDELTKSDYLCSGLKYIIHRVFFGKEFKKPKIEYAYEHTYIKNTNYNKEIYKNIYNYNEIITHFFKFDKAITDRINDLFIKKLKDGNILRIEINIRTSNEELENLQTFINKYKDTNENQIIILLNVINQIVKQYMYKVVILLSIHEIDKETKKPTGNNHHFIILYNPNYSFLNDDKDIYIIQTWLGEEQLYSKKMSFNKYIEELKGSKLFKDSNSWKIENNLQNSSNSKISDTCYKRKRSVINPNNNANMRVAKK